MRWLYHLAPASLRDAVPSAGAEGFVHCSFREAVRESARLYFPADAEVVALRIDPRRVVDLRVEATPRGPMPHVYGAIAREAIVDVLPLTAFPDAAPDVVD